MEDTNGLNTAKAPTTQTFKPREVTMARDDRPNDKGKVRVRVIEFDMEGSNQTLRDSIRDIVGAIGRAPQLRAPVAPKALGSDAATATKGASTPETADEVFDAEIEEGTEETEGSIGTTRKRSPPRSPVVLDIDLKQGSIPLADFLQKLNPQGDMDKYAAIAYWLKNNAGIAEVSMDHIHTGYRTMKWNTPMDAGQPLRNMKKREYGYMRAGSKAGFFVLIHTGDNHVNDLRKAAGMDA